MTIIAWKEAAAHATLTASRGGKREWSAPYILTSDNPRDDAQTCVDFMDTIGRGLSDTFRYADREDSASICKTVSPVRMTSSVLLWSVTCQYAPPGTSEGGEDEDGNPTDNPLLRRWDISCGTQTFETPVWKAWNVDEMPLGGAGGGYRRSADALGPVHNSAGVVYDPPLTRPTPETVVRISGNHPEYWQAILMVNAGAINQFEVSWSDTLTKKYGFRKQAFAPYCVLCSAATADFNVENNLKFWRYTFEFRCRTRADATNPQDGFLESILDRGITRIANAGAPDGKGGTYTSGDFKAGMAEAAAIRDVEDRRIPEMILLDGHGQPLFGCDTYNAPPVYFRWRVHPYGAFNILPLQIWRG